MGFRKSLFYRLESSLRYSNLGRRFRRWSSKRRTISRGQVVRTEFGNADFGAYLPGLSNTGRKSGSLGLGIGVFILCLFVIAGIFAFLYDSGYIGSFPTTKISPLISSAKISLEESLKLTLDKESSKALLDSAMPKNAENRQLLSLGKLLRKVGRSIRELIPRTFGIDPSVPTTILADQISGLDRVEPPLTEVSRERIAVAAFAGISKPEQPAKAVVKPADKLVEPSINSPEPKKPFKTPVVVIYHTHTSETYSDEKVNYIWEVRSPSATDEEYIWGTAKGVVTVGTELSTALSKRGVKVIHSKRVHDYPSFRDSYKNSLKTVEGLLENNPDADMVIDLHRDGLAAANSTTVIDGKKAARVFIAVTTDKFGLPHPNWKQNYAFALRLNAAIEKEYPGLSRGVVLRDDARWNQHVHDHAIILEIGSNQNSISEALVTAELIVTPILKVLESE